MQPNTTFASTHIANISLLHYYFSTWAVPGTEHVFIVRMNYSLGFEERWEALKCNSIHLPMLMQGASCPQRTYDGCFLCVMRALGFWRMDAGIPFVWPGVPSCNIIRAKREAEATTNLHPSAKWHRQNGDQGQTWAECRESLLCHPHHGNKTWITVDANTNGHVTIRVRPGCGGLRNHEVGCSPMELSGVEGVLDRGTGKLMTYYDPDH